MPPEAGHGLPVHPDVYYVPPARAVLLPHPPQRSGDQRRVTPTLAASIPNFIQAASEALAACRSPQ